MLTQIDIWNLTINKVNKQLFHSHLLSGYYSVYSVAEFFSKHPLFKSQIIYPLQPVHRQFWTFFLQFLYQ